MAISFELRGRVGVKGVAEGEAMVSREPNMISPLNDANGIVNIPGHELEGKSIKDKIVVLPDISGNSMWDWWFYMKKGLTTPKAVLYTCDFPHVCATTGHVLADIPMMYGFGENLFSLIETGDRIKVDANKGTIEVTKAEIKKD